MKQTHGRPCEAEKGVICRKSMQCLSQVIAVSGTFAAACASELRRSLSDLWPLLRQSVCGKYSLSAYNAASAV